MPIITKISVQKNNAERYNVFLDGNYAFSVDEEVLARFQLQKGKELSDLEISEIDYQDDIRKGVNTAIQYLSYRMRSEKEVSDYLKQKDINEMVIQEVIHKLYSLKYLNDLEFAIAFVRTQMNTTKKGPGIIKIELRDKGISENNIETALQEFTNEQQQSHAIDLVEKTVRQNQKLSEKILKQKIEQTLLRKGYFIETIQLAMDEIDFTKDESEEWDAIVEQGTKAKRKYQKYDGYEYKQKMKQALYRKGFSIDLIERFLNEYEV
ncbi:recombination regulator RecX [Heyndrickxia sp. NPDC080065]|uniref:recombination regulator RecX n=1 Tax=Heyndrickxia sp. NPDC080065 TaxID=3390568 RepID=UPI003CFDDD1F